MKIILKTRRLLLREITPEDLDFMAELLGDPDVMHFWPRPYTRQEAEIEISNLQRKYAAHGSSFWLAIDKTLGQPIGQAGILIQQVNGSEEAELAYKIHRPFWRQGYATEASIACLNYAFNVLGRPRVVARIRPENIPSTNLAMKLGMRPGGDAELAGFHHVVFSISKPEAERCS
jgi:RimJ/RimL family protein N-acetyltransferase